MTIVTKITDAASSLKTKVGSTMGPNGYNVSILTQKDSPIRITKDGATVARFDNSDDPETHGFIRNIAQVASSVETEVGDGTTTATVMSTTLLTDLIRLVANGKHPRAIINDLDKLLDQMKGASETYTTSATEDTIYPIAHISTNHDEKMAQSVTDVVKEIGPYGRFRCETGGGDVDIINTTRGYTIDTAIVNEMLLNSTDGRRTEDGNLIVHNGELTMDALAEILATIKINEGLRNVFVACDNISQQDTIEIIELIHNFNRAGIQRIYPIALSSVPRIRQHQRDDLTNLFPDTICRVTMEIKRTTFHIDSSVDIEPYIKSVEENDANVGSGFDLEIRKERIQRLRGGYATIMATGATDAERQERRDRFNDAILAAQSALREGYTIGGGNHYLRIHNVVRDAVPAYLKSAIENYLTAVYRQVHLNSGVDNDIINNMITHTTEDTVFELVDFSDTATEFVAENYPVIDSAGTPIRVLEATRSIIHTLLPVCQHVPLHKSTVAF